MNMYFWIHMSFGVQSLVNLLDLHQEFPSQQKDPEFVVWLDV